MDSEIVRCPQCGQANRVPALGSGRKAVCGRCKTELSASAGGPRHPIVLDDARFSTTIASGAPFVVDFWAAWCGPCRTIAPILDAMAAERTDVTFAKLDVDANPRAAASVGVQGIPLLVFFNNGVEKGRLVGAHPRSSIEAAIRQYLG